MPAPAARLLVRIMDASLDMLSLSLTMASVQSEDHFWFSMVRSIHSLTPNSCFRSLLGLGVGDFPPSAWTYDGVDGMRR